MSRQHQDSLERIKYTAYPFQVIEYPTGIILRRGNTQILLEGDEAIPTILVILKSTSGTKSTLEGIVDLFPPFRKAEIQSLLNELIEKRFLVDEKKVAEINVFEETNANVFYWQLNKDTSKIKSLFEEKKIFILGNNSLSRYLKESIIDTGFKSVEVVPYGPLNAFPKSEQKLLNQEKSFEQWKLDQKDLSNSIIIGASAFGGQILMLELNEFCVSNDIHFIPVNIDRMKAEIGPLVVPRQTACLQCLRSRQNAHLHNIQLERYAEQYAYDGQEVSGTVSSILKSAAEIAAFELVRAYGDFIPNYQSSLIVMDLLKATMSSTPVLKIPRCAVCSSMVINPTILTDKPNP